MPQRPQQKLYALHLSLSKLYPKVIEELSAGYNLIGWQVAILLQK